MGRYSQWFEPDPVPEPETGSQTSDGAQKEATEAPEELPPVDGQQTAEIIPEGGAAADAGQAETDIPGDSFSDLDDISPDADPADISGDDTGIRAESGEDEDVKTFAPLPGELAERDVTPTLKPRYKEQTDFNDQVRSDWLLIIEEHPDAFQALLYRPDVGTYGVVDDESGLESFTELDNNQRPLTYSDPVLVSVLDNPDGRESFETLDDDTDQDGMGDDILILRIAAEGVTVGSILEWNEETLNGVVRRWWYVHRIFSYGTQRVGSLYYCIPARNFDRVEEGKITHGR